MADPFAQASRIEISIMKWPESVDGGRNRFSAVKIWQEMTNFGNGTYLLILLVWPE